MIASISGMPRRRGSCRPPLAPGGLRGALGRRFDWRREIHPVLANYPAALLLFGCLLDLAGRRLDAEREASRVRVWLQCLAAVTVDVLFAL